MLFFAAFGGSWVTEESCGDHFSDGTTLQHLLDQLKSGELFEGVARRHDDYVDIMGCLDRNHVKQPL